MIVLLTHPDSSHTKQWWKELISQAQYSVVYFYPKDSTPGCTIEAHDFSSLQADFEALWCQIIGVSKDSVSSHQKFINKECITFPLITDDKLEVHNQFNVLWEKSMYGRKYLWTIRSTFLLNHHWEIIQERRNVSTSNHAQNVLEKTKKVVMDSVK